MFCLVYALVLLSTVPLCTKYNIMRLVSNNKIKMAEHRRSSAYYVFVLYDHFLRMNDEDVECSLWCSLPSRKKLSTFHAFWDGRAGFSCQVERFTHSAALLQTEQRHEGILCCLLPLKNISNPPWAYSTVCLHTWASYSSENVSASLCARFSSCVGTAGWPKSLD